MWICSANQSISFPISFSIFIDSKSLISKLSVIITADVLTHYTVTRFSTRWHISLHYITLHEYVIFCSPGQPYTKVRFQLFLKPTSKLPNISAAFGNSLYNSFPRAIYNGMEILRVGKYQLIFPGPIQPKQTTGKSMMWHSLKCC